MLSAFLTYNVKAHNKKKKRENPFHFKNTNQFTHKPILLSILYLYEIYMSFLQ